MSNLYNYYRSELKSKNIARYKLIGITTELILDSSFFNKNEEIVPFLLKVYNLSFKEYVIKSRTMIIARTSREIYKLDSKQYENLRKRIFEFLNNHLENEGKNENTKSGKADFTKWMDGIADVEK